MAMSVNERLERARAAKAKKRLKKPSNTSPKKPKQLANQDGEIRSGVSYTIKRFEQLTGMGPHSRRVAQRNGLRTVIVGNSIHILGDDWLAYLRKLANEQCPDDREK